MSLLIFPNRKVKWNSKKTPSWNSTVVTLGRGRRKSITNRAYPSWEISVNFTGITQREYEEILGFLCNVGAGAFLWYDHEDHRQINVKVGQGDGQKTDFQLLRYWGGTRNNNLSFAEPVTDVDEDTLRVYVEGQQVTNFKLKEDGIISFNTAPQGLIQADFIYYWRVALDGDVSFEAVYRNFYETGTLKLVSV